MTFDGLYTYEIALLLGGALLFAVLLIALVWLVFRNRPYTKLLPFFALSIVMMGFPAISSFQIKDGTIAIEKQTHDLQSKPEDAQARAALERDVSKIASRPIRDPKVLTTLAQAQFALGHDQQAEANVNTALSAEPGSARATELKTKIELTRNLTTLTNKAEAQPNDAKVREELQSTYTRLSQQPVANPKALETLSRARIVLSKPVAAAAPAHQ